MKLLCLILTFVIGLTLGARPDVDPFPSLPVRRYKINLDLPLEKAYRDVVMDNLDGMKKFERYLFGLIPFKIPNFAFNIIGFIGKWIDPKSYDGSDFMEFIEMYAKLSGNPFGMVYILNHMYEFQQYCTSIVINDP